MSEFQNIKRSLNDFFSKDILKFAFLPLIVSIVVLYFIFFSTVNTFLPDENLIQIEQTHTVTHNGVTTITTQTTTSDSIIQAILNYILKSTLTSYMMSFLIYTVGSVFVVILSIFISLIVISFFTPKVLEIIRNKHYPQRQMQSYASFSLGLWIMIKSFVVMIVLLILFIPLYFIPIVNIIAFNIPFFYMFHKVLNYDISSAMMDKDEFAIIQSRYGYRFVFRSIFLYLLSLIPFMGLFVPLFYIVYLGNSYFLALEILKKSN